MSNYERVTMWRLHKDWQKMVEQDGVRTTFTCLITQMHYVYSIVQSCYSVHSFWWSY